MKYGVMMEPNAVATLVNIIMPICSAGEAKLFHGLSYVEEGNQNICTRHIIRL